MGLTPLVWPAPQGLNQTRKAHTRPTERPPPEIPRLTRVKSLPLEVSAKRGLAPTFPHLSVCPPHPPCSFPEILTSFSLPQDHLYTFTVELHRGAWLCHIPASPPSEWRGDPHLL